MAEIAPASCFRLILEREFDQDCLDEYPIWSELYDYFEREEIISWGVNSEWLEQEIERVHHVPGHWHSMYPLLQSDLLGSRIRVYIKADLETPYGQKLRGYVINEDAYVVHIFYGDKNFSFSNRKSTKELDEAKAKLLRNLLDDKDDPIFPLKYHTDFKGPDGRQIEGYFLSGSI